MREGKEKNGSAQPGAIHNPCSQAFNTVSKVLEVQTVEFTFQSTDNPQYFLTPWWHQQRTQCQSPCPTGEALGQAAVSLTSVLQEKAAAHPLQLKPVVARTAPYSSQGSAVLGYPGSQVHCDGLQCPAHAILWQV